MLVRERTEVSGNWRSKQLSLSGTAAGLWCQHSKSTTTSLQRCYCPHCCLGLYSADRRCFLVDWLEKTEKHLTLSPTELLYSITPSSCSPPTPPFFVNFMDLSANGLPPHHPLHIWHLQPDLGRLLPFIVEPPLALRGRPEPAAGEGGGSSPPSSFYLVNWSAAVIPND